MRPDGSLEAIVSLRHDLKFNDDFELVGGTFELVFAGGTRRVL